MTGFLEFQLPLHWQVCYVSFLKQRWLRPSLPPCTLPLTFQRSSWMTPKDCNSPDKLERRFVCFSDLIFKKYDLTSHKYDEGHSFELRLSWAKSIVRYKYFFQALWKVSKLSHSQLGKSSLIMADLLILNFRAIPMQSDSIFFPDCEYSIQFNNFMKWKFRLSVITNSYSVRNFYTKMREAKLWRQKLIFWHRMSI